MIPKLRALFKRVVPNLPRHLPTIQLLERFLMKVPATAVVRFTYTSLHCFVRAVEVFVRQSGCKALVTFMLLNSSYCSTTV